MMMTLVYLGLGANLHEPLQQLSAAVKALAEIPQSRLVQVSGFYGSKPMGPQDQPDYVNAVAALETALAPEALLDHLQRIELEQGRVRKAERWGPRTLDLDILLFGSQVLATTRLTVPHYGMAVREFVLYPLAEIAPDLEIPTLGPIGKLLAQVPRNGLSLLSQTKG
jgi:2-amino-4-hydroxy-6-hydroxymethyldihydropteridine diphosphokinase